MQPTEYARYDASRRRLVPRPPQYRVVYFDVHPNSVQRLPFTLTESSVLAVIPARFHATRLPGKILADIAGRSMIEHVYRRASAASTVHAVIVATDDERIADAVRAFGGAPWMTRADHVSGTDRIAEVVSQLPCRCIVNVQGDEPLIEPATPCTSPARLFPRLRLVWPREHPCLPRPAPTLGYTCIGATPC